MWLMSTSVYAADQVGRLARVSNYVIEFMNRQRDWLGSMSNYSVEEFALLAGTGVIEKEV